MKSFRAYIEPLLLPCKSFAGNLASMAIQPLFDEPFLRAQWLHALRDLNVTEAFNANRLLKLLLTLRTTTDAPLRDRILTLDHEITTLDATIAA